MEGEATVLKQIMRSSQYLIKGHRFLEKAAPYLNFGLEHMPYPGERLMSEDVVSGLVP